MVKKRLKWFAVASLVPVLLIAGFLWHLEFFSTPKVVVREMGPYTYVYERFVGPYMDAASVFEKVGNALKAEGLIAEQAIGVYYDDPDKVAKEKLRSDCGLVLKENDLSKVPALKKKFSIATMPKKMSMVVEFPVKTTLSYLLGPMKCYPAIEKYARAKGYKAAVPYELYFEDKILFVMEIVP